MTRTLAPAPARRRGIAATALALVVGLLAAGSPLAAAADELPTTGSIVGTVTTPDGAPIEGINVWTFSGLSATTDADGHFEWIDLAFTGYNVSVAAVGYQQPGMQYRELTAEAPDAVVDFVLVPYEVGNGTITGLLTGDGVPLPGATIGAFEAASGQNVDTVTDENGVYQFTGLANGEWQLFVWASQDYQPSPVPSVVLSDAAPDATLDIPLLSWPVGTASISGVLTDSETGAPIPDVYIYLSGTTVPHNSASTTDASGAYSFNALPAGSFSLSFDHPGYINVTKQLTLSNGQSKTFNRAVVPTNATISGHIAGPGGVPAADLQISAQSTGGHFAGAVTDANGDYVIPNVGAGTYTVSVGGNGTPFTLKEKKVTAVAHANVIANFTLANRTTGSIAGRILTVSGEDHITPVCATLYNAKKKELETVVTIGDNFGDGGYTFNDVKPGSYTVKFRDCDDDPSTKFTKVWLGDAKKFKDARFITVTAGLDSYDNTVTLVPRGQH